MTNEKKQTPAWSLLKKRELTQCINALAEELEDLRTEKKRILTSFDPTDDKDMSEVRKWTKQQEATIQPLTAQQDHCEKELGHAREEYEDLSAHASSFNQNTLWPERLKELETMTRQTEEQLRAYYGSNFSHQ